MIPKTFNNNIKLVKTKKKDLEEEFENDNYLIQTIKRTTKFQNDKKLNELLNDLDDILNHISITIGLSNAPKAKLLHDENNQFLKEYKFFSEKFETQTKQVLKDLIIKYSNKGYHIPNFSHKNNIFKVDALIEENTNKMRLMLMEDLKNKHNIIAPKTLMFLNKLNYLIKKRTANNSDIINQYYKTLKKNEALTRRLSIEKVKEDIQNMINLIKKVKINKIGSVQPKRKSSYLVENRQFNNLKLPNSKTVTKTELTQVNIDDNENKGDTNTNNNTILSTKEVSLNSFNKRNPLSFLSLRLKKDIIKPQKLLDSLISKNQTESSQHIENINKTENNINTEKKIFLKKSKPIINLKKQNFFSKEKNNNIRIKTANNIGKINNFISYSKKTTHSDIGKYIRKAKRYKLYQSAKKAYYLGLKKINDNTKINGFSLKEISNKNIENSYYNSIKNYNISKNQIDTKKGTSRNINLSSDTIKKGKTLKVEEKKSQFLQNAYMKIKNGNYDSIEDIIHKYLKEVKKVNSNEEKDLMDYYNHKNFRNNLIELNMKVGDDSIRKKIEKIYYNTYILKRITNTLNIMKEKENNIDRLEKIYTSGANVNH